ncbi:MAG: aminoglycoside N(3)-acetyltransferase [Halanaeroarchaeum sp.]
MAEQESIARVEEPATVDSVVADLRALGVTPGDTVIAHTSLSALGWVVGGAQAVGQALQRAVTDRGTVVVPTHTAQYTDPAEWENPPVPDDWIPVIRSSMPAFRPAVTPVRDVGVVPETFRTFPGVARSRHPVYSFAAWGAHGEAVVEDHAFDDGLGEGSPLARVYDRGGAVLLLGVDHHVNTSLHLAEYRADIDLPTERNVAPVLVDDERTMVEMENLAIDSDDFAALGEAFEDEHEVTKGSVGAATATLVDQRAIVDFAVEWLEANR